MVADNMVEELLVGLGFEFDGEAGEQFKKQTEVVASVINKIAVAAAVATTALVAMAKTQAGVNDELGKTANTLDTSAESLAKWKQAAEIAGIPGEQVIGMLERLKQTAQDAIRTGAGPFQAYAELGVDFESLASGALDVADGLEVILRNARGMDRALAQSALRELGIDVNLLELTPEQIQTAFSNVEKFGGITEKLTEDSAKFNDELARMRLFAGGAANELTSRLLPAFTQVVVAIQDGLKWLQTTGLPVMDELADSIGGWETALIALAGTAAIPAIIKSLTIMAGLISKSAVGLAAIAGFMAGDFIFENLLNEETKTGVGRKIAKTLAFFGSEEAQQALEVNEAINPLKGLALPAIVDTGVGGIFAPQATAGGVAPSVGAKSITNINTFNGLNTNDIETMMRHREREQIEALDDDANDPIVR